LFDAGFILDLPTREKYNPRTLRQAVSFQGVGTDHPFSPEIGLLIFGEKRAPTSTNVAQTLSIKARQCQDDFRSLERAPETDFEFMNAMGLEGSWRSSVAANASHSVTSGRRCFVLRMQTGFGPIRTSSGSAELKFGFRANEG
jgi:hypothetical protein